MNTQPSSRELKVMEARAKATSRAEMAELLGISSEYVSTLVALFDLPRFGRHRVHNDERLNEIKSLWVGGRSALDIGRGLGMTKGQVCGVLSRAGLMRTRVAAPRKKKSRRLEFANKTPKSRHISVVPFDPRSAPVIPLNISFMDLQSHHCREPYGDGPNFTYCGHPVAYRSYCCAHASINYTPAQARNRDPRPR